MRLIETDAFPFEFLSKLAERESWRKEIHRPIYHVHKWWAKRLGSVFRGILLGAHLPEGSDLPSEFYKTHDIRGVSVFDPFMGSGTTVGEAHKLGCTGLGRDINPVAVESVRTALGTLDRSALLLAFERLDVEVGQTIRTLYRSKDHKGRLCDVLYFFWVMQVPCLACGTAVDLFPSWVIARNAYPDKKPEVQILCPYCGDIFPAMNGSVRVSCPSCAATFDPNRGPANGGKAMCRRCEATFNILEAVAPLDMRPPFRLYGKLVLTTAGQKRYLPATAEDHAAYKESSARLEQEIEKGHLILPDLELAAGYNTEQAMRYKFTAWRHFFNNRQLLALAQLRHGILKIENPAARKALLTLFSGVLEFNNLFASYKGEGTGAVRHMFSHHILKPERTPIEANVWGTQKSSGSFSTLFRTRLLRAVEYRTAPIEIRVNADRGQVCAEPFTGRLEQKWPIEGCYADRGLYLSCGDSAETGLPDSSVDLVITDPPFFDNVHYSELADFFYAWQQLPPMSSEQARTTRSTEEVQDTNPASFAKKLTRVLQECRRVLKDAGLLVFTYHHSRDEGWKALAHAVLDSGFVVVNSHPVKAEMSVATPKARTKEPIQLDIIIVCRKAHAADRTVPGRQQAIEMARRKTHRLQIAGLNLSRNDQKIVLFGQLLATLRSPEQTDCFTAVENEFEEIEYVSARVEPQLQLF